jgi:hypothetical protein
MGAKQPVLPTEELWQLHLRDRSLIGRLRMSQLGRKPSPKAGDPKGRFCAGFSEELVRTENVR